MKLSSLLAKSAEETLIPIDDTDGVFLGMGYDTLTDQFHSGIVAVPHSPPPEGEVPTGQKVYSYIDILENTTEFLETLNISMSASAKGFGGKASASYSLYRSLTMNTKDVFALFYVTVIDQVTRLYDPALSDRAKEEWANQESSNRKQALVRTYGDSYVSRIVTGGRLLALFRISANSRREREEIRISGKASFASFRVSGDYKHIEEFFTQHTHTVMDIRRDGAAGRLPNMDLRSLIDAALAFPEEVRKDKVQIFAAASPISHIQDGDTNISVHSPKAFDAVDQLGKLQAVIRERRSEADFILAHPELFMAIESDDVKSTMDVLEVYAEEATSAYTEIVQDRFSFQLQKELPDARDLPSLPRIVGGTVVPLAMHLNGKHIYGTAWDVDGVNDQWLNADALFGMSIRCPDMSPGTDLKYSLLDNLGNKPEGKNGSTVTISEHAQMAIGMSISVAGEHASRYSVTYAIKTGAGNAVYYAQDGELLSVWRLAVGWRIIAIKVGMTLIS